MRQSGAPVNPFPWEKGGPLTLRRLGNTTEESTGRPAPTRDPPLSTRPAGEENGWICPVSAFIELESVK